MMFEEPNRQEYPLLKMPVLLIIGQSDRSVPPLRFAPVGSALRMTASILNLARPNNFHPPRPGDAAVDFVGRRPRARRRPGLAVVGCAPRWRSAATPWQEVPYLRSPHRREPRGQRIPSEPRPRRDGRSGPAYRGRVSAFHNRSKWDMRALPRPSNGSRPFSR
jgi:hypothetical protein